MSTTLQILHDAITAAEANLIEKQTVSKGYSEKEAQMIARNEKLQARKNEIAGILKKFDDDMIAAVGNDTARPTLDGAALRAELAAIEAAIAAFPAQLADHRMRSGPVTSGWIAAQGAVKSVKFNLAIHKYRLAMKDVWQFADAVRQAAADTNMWIDLEGLADSASRFGRLPADAT